ncbi:ropporin-1-like protein isoform X3 [Trachemys scripta elegans]|uniref:ropporin-1-like protein isoform X3 n=1 Tax=Trachemys scripta elegans TaxID=31138 RepID=UPI0015579171|nr:ropporin-1-like protein isoform X3 [Trachemys scripta elegans]
MATVKHKRCPGNWRGRAAVTRCPSERAAARRTSQLNSFRILLLDLTRIMPLPDTMFCAQQINIPPELPDILKQFTKAAIRTQPHDVLQWSAGYFSALSKGEPLPVKDRIEMPVATQKTDTGLTPGLLKVLHKQLSPKGRVSMIELEKKWKHLCLPVEQLRALLQLDNFGEEVEWLKVLALGCSILGGRSTEWHGAAQKLSDPGLLDLFCHALTWPVRELQSV